MTKKNKVHDNVMIYFVVLSNVDNNPPIKRIADATISILPTNFVNFSSSYFAFFLWMRYYILL